MKTRSRSRTRKPKTVTIVGFGRFGKTLLKLLAGDFDIVISSGNPQKINKKLLPKRAKVAADLEEAFKSGVVFYTVPIGQFEQIVKSHQKFIKPEHLIID